MRSVSFLALSLLACTRAGFDGEGSDASPQGLDGGSDDRGAADRSAGRAASPVQVLAPGHVSAKSTSVKLKQTSGNLLVAAAYWNTAAVTVTVTDTAGQTWSSLPSESIASGCDGPGAGTKAQLWYTAATQSGDVTVTVAQSSTTNPLALVLAEYGGVAASLEASAGDAAGAASNLMTSGELKTTADTLIVGLFHDSDGAGIMEPGPGWTARALDQNSYSMFVDNAPGVGAGTYQVTGRLPGTRSDACWVATAAAFHLR
jgi:hypothetical protein